MKKFFETKYDNIISVQNLLKAWEEFLPSKKNKTDVCEFSKNLIENILNLHESLVNKSYKHGGYKAFNISDPKPRNIHKASVRDRLLHHAIYRKLYPYFDHLFIFDSYSCRLGKGTHKAIERFKQFSNKVSKNNTKQCWILKCDIRFFASIDHQILIKILKEYITDENIIWLLDKTLSSGLDFLGWVNFPKFRVLRTSTKKRVVKSLYKTENINSLLSYCGLLKHGNQFLLKRKVEEKIKILKNQQLYK